MAPVAVGGIVAGVGVAGRVAADVGSSGGTVSTAIILAVLAALGTGGVAAVRVLFVERPGTRNSEVKDLREHNRRLIADETAARQALDDEREQWHIERQKAAVEAAMMQHRVWQAEQERARALAELAAIQAELARRRGDP